jgi:hypothetical protein
VKRLTPKQEKFVHGLVSGMSQREAYLCAYSASRMKPETVDKRASELFAKGEVAGRYDELMAEIASRVMWDRERATRDLLEVREIALSQIRQTKKHKVHFDEHSKRDLADLPKAAVQLVISSTAELNKMFGIYDKGDASDGRVVIVDDV